MGYRIDLRPHGEPVVFETPWRYVFVAYAVYILAVPVYLFAHDRILNWAVNYLISHANRLHYSTAYDA